MGIYKRRQGENMVVGYVRVSTEDQYLDRQFKILNELGAEKIFSEKLSGKNLNRPQLKEMLGFIREGDTVAVESISRLARSTKDLLNIVSELSDKSIGFRSQKENIDTTTPQGRFVLTIFSALAELERESLLQRQTEGIQAAKIRGVRFGRPSIKRPKEWESVISRWKSGEIKAVEAMKLLDLSKSSFYKLLKMKS